MAMQVIDVGTRRAALKAAAAENIGRGVEQAAFLLAHGIEKQIDRMEKEKTQKLAAMGTLASKYGFSKMGPDFTMEFERLSGVKFPRDERGMPSIPMTDEEAMIAKVKPHVDKFITENPDQAVNVGMGLLGMTDKPKSLIEQAQKDRDLSIQEAYNNARIGIDMLNARANMIRATRPVQGSARVAQSNQPSGFMVDPMDPKGLRPVPWDGKSKQLTWYEVDQRADLRKIEKMEQSLAIDHAKQVTSERTADNQELRAFADGYAKARKANDRVTAERFKALIDTHMTVKKGMEPPVKPQSWSEWFKAWFPTVNTVDPRVNEINSKVINSPANQSPSSRIQSMSDDELSALLKQRMAEGADPAELFAQSGNSMRVLEILSRMGAANGR